MSERHPTSNVHYYSLYIVNSRAFKTVYFKFGGVWNSVTKLLVLVRLLVEFEPLKVSKKYFWTGLNLDLFGGHLLCQTLFAVKFVRLVE